MPGTPISEAPITRAELDAILTPIFQRLTALEAAHELVSDPVPVSPEIEARIAAWEADPRPGIPHEEILREFGL
jgi:hypothetical protein